MKLLCSINCFTNNVPVIRQGLTTVAICLCLVFIGFNQGYSAVLLPQLEKDDTFPYERTQGSWIAALPTLFMMAGCFAAGPLLDSLGRKITLLIFFFPQIGSWLIMGFSQNVTVLNIGRFLAGFVCGATRAISVVYLGEISDPKYRGVILFAPSVGVCLGVLIIHFIGVCFYWKTVAFIVAGISVAMFAVIFFLTESPLWLISKGKREQGTQVFRWFRGTREDAEKELLAAIEKVNERESEVSGREIVKSMFKSSFLKPLFIVSLVCLNVQFSGVNPICFYALEIIQETFKGKIDADLMMTAADAVRLVVVIGNGFLGKRFSRRIMFFVSAFLCAIALFLSCAFLSYNPPHFAWVSVVLFVIYVASSSSLVTLSWSFIGEVFPTNLRGIGCSLSSCFTFLSLFVALKVTLAVLEQFGIVALNATFASVTLVTAILLLWMLPETNGKTLQDIEDIYSNKDKAPPNRANNII